MCVCVGESSAGSSLTDPSLLAVFYDYIKLMPMMAEANQMSQELNKVTIILKYVSSNITYFLFSWHHVFIVMY